MGIQIENKKVVYEEYKEVPVSATCDVCNKELSPVYYSFYGQNDRKEDAYNFYQITTSHNDWGNDSIDSYEYFIACCPDCALKFMEKYLKENFKLGNTKHIEIERLNKLSNAHFDQY